jgi:NitT/TauT family transport system permease protein
MLSRLTDKPYRLIGGAALIGLWQTASVFMSDITMASPVEAFGAAWRMICDPVFLKEHLSISIMRTVLALMLGSLCGFFLGVLAGRFEPVMDFLEPSRRLMTSIPAVVATVLAMLWFGMGSVMVIVLSTVFIVPTVYVNIAESMVKCDKTYTEMAFVYRFSSLMRLKYIYLPAVYAALTASLVVTTGNSMRLVILAEVMGAGEGLGYVLGISRARLDMPTLYGCVLISFGFVWLGENIIRRILRRRTGWKKTSANSAA